MWITGRTYLVTSSSFFRILARAAVCSFYFFLIFFSSLLLLLLRYKITLKARRTERDVCTRYGRKRNIKHRENWKRKFERRRYIFTSFSNNYIIIFIVCFFHPALMVNFFIVAVGLGGNLIIFRNLKNRTQTVKKLTYSILHHIYFRGHHFLYVIITPDLVIIRKITMIMVKIIIIIIFPVHQ